MIDSLPKDFDWRNKDGENFLGAPVPNVGVSLTKYIYYVCIHT